MTQPQEPFTPTGAASSSGAPEPAAGRSPNCEGPPPADPLAALRAAALDLPDPIDALAAAATLAASYPTSAAAREAARMLRAYGLAHSARIAANKRAAEGQAA